MQLKAKKCFGNGLAKGHGCGDLNINRKYGLGLICGCYQHWLLNTDEGKVVLNKRMISSQKKVAKDFNKKAREFKEQNTDYKKLLQVKINEIVRLIDIGLPCLAKGVHSKQIHAGHIYSRGAHIQIRYNLHNIHRQSAQSNHFQNEDGLLREGLRLEYGNDYFEFVSGLRATKTLNYSNDEYKLFYIKSWKIAIRLRKEGKTYGIKERIIMRNEINNELGIYLNEFNYYLCNKY